MSFIRYKDYRFPDNLPRCQVPKAESALSQNVAWPWKELFFPPLLFFVRSRDSFVKMYERCAKKCLKKIAFLAHLRRIWGVTAPRQVVGTSSSLLSSSWQNFPARPAEQDDQPAERKQRWFAIPRPRCVRTVPSVRIATTDGVI